MRPLNVLIADDEPIAREILLSFVARVPQLCVVAVCKNAQEVITAVNNNTVHLMLLDINMPEISGIDALKMLRNPPPVIFTTAYTQYAVESYELNTVDYLLKPFSFDRFLKAINKAIDQREHHRTLTELPDNDLFVKADGKLVKINTEDLILVAAEKDYVKLFTADKSLMILSTMKNMEEQLSAFPQFIRVHKSYIVNLSHITEVDGNNMKLGKHCVTIGSTYKDIVAARLHERRL